MTFWDLLAVGIVLLGGLALCRGQAVSILMKVFCFSMQFETKHRERR